MIGSDGDSGCHHYLIVSLQNNRTMDSKDVASFALALYSLPTSEQHELLRTFMKGLGIREIIFFNGNYLE